MKRKNFFYLIFISLIFFVFIRISQHNLLIKISYEKQRLEKKRQKLIQKKYIQLSKLYSLKDFKRIKNIAQEKLELKELKLSQIITLT